MHACMHACMHAYIHTYIHTYVCNCPPDCPSRAHYSWYSQGGKYSKGAVRGVVFTRDRTRKGVIRSVFKISKLFLRPRPWQFEIWDSTDKWATYLLLGFETLNLKFCDLKLWKLTVRQHSTQASDVARRTEASEFACTEAGSWTLTMTRKGGCYGWKPSSSSNFSIRAFRAYPFIEIRRTSPCWAIRGNSISVNSALPPPNDPPSRDPLRPFLNLIYN